MMTMTELFYGPSEPTWIVHPHYRAAAAGRRFNEQPLNNNNTNTNTSVANPYLIYADDGFTYRRNPYMQPHAVPYASMVAPDGTTGAVRGAMYPYQAQYFVHGATPNAIAVEGHNHHHNHKPAQSPARPGVLQPRNGMHVQTLHFMVPLCCEKCEDKVKEQLLDLDDVQRVTCDQWKQKVTVTSSIAPDKLLARLQRIKKRSSFWPQHVAGAVKVFNGNEVNQPAQRNQKSDDIENQAFNVDENNSSSIMPDAS